MEIIHVDIVREPGFEDIPAPAYATAGSAGVDLRAAIARPIHLHPGERAAISAGIRLALPQGYEAQVRPRSGLASRHGITLLNSPGTIDSDYRGIVHAVLINHGQLEYVVHRGDRIAQMVICPVARVQWNELTDLSETDRGHGGFGHTGVK